MSIIGAELHVVGGKHGGQVISLSQKKFLIGREQDCHLRPNSELVSRHHCVFTVDGFSVRLRDLGSTNGTFVNGEQIRKEIVLSAGDRVVVGSLEFSLKIKTSEDATANAEAKTDVTEQMPQETVVAGGDTLFELESVSTKDEPTLKEPPADEVAAPETAPPDGSQAAAEPAAANPQLPPGQSTGDTTVMNQPVMMPGQVPYQPMMPQMGYPQQMYGGYPYPNPGMPMYPQQMPGMMPGYPGYPQQQGMPPQQENVAEESSAAPDVSLPDPSQTGAKEEPPKGSGGGGKTEESTGAADQIIKQYMQRRPS